MAISTTVRNLGVGMVMSLPETGLEPSLIVGITGPVGDVRFIDLVDLPLGDPVEARLCLGLDRGVLVHEVVARHHSYTNTTDGSVEVVHGNRSWEVEPGETYHYTGQEAPAVFPAAAFRHESHPVEVATEERPV